MITSIKAQPLWRTTISLSLLCALFTAIYKAMDNYTVHNIATASDGLTAAFAYLIVGAWIGVLSGFVFATLFGKKLIDPDFAGIVWQNRQMHLQAAIAGAISAGSTLFLLWGNQTGDPSTVIALGNLVIVYTTIYDVMRKEVSWRSMIAPVILVVSGGAMAAWGGSVYVTLLGIFLIAILSNGLTAVSEFVEQKGARASDGVNLFLWRFVWIAVFGTLLGYSVTYLRGPDYLSMLAATMANITVYWWWIIATMFFVFLGIGFKLVAKKNDVVSVVLLVMSVQMVIGYPIVYAGNLIVPGAFGDLPIDPGIWIVRGIGACLMIIGIYLLSQRDTKVTN